MGISLPETAARERQMEKEATARVMHLRLEHARDIHLVGLKKHPQETPERVAQWAFLHADAFLKEVGIELKPPEEESPDEPQTIQFPGTGQ